MGAARKVNGNDSRTDRIPAIDLVAAHVGLKEDLDAAVQRVLASGRYIGGPEVEGLEREFAEFCGVPHAVAVASGTDALRFALMTAGVGAGSEVITSPFTFIATTEAVTQAGASPVFVDVDPESLTLDPQRLAAALTPKTKAIVPVTSTARRPTWIPSWSWPASAAWPSSRTPARRTGRSTEGVPPDRRVRPERWGTPAVSPSTQRRTWAAAVRVESSRPPGPRSPSGSGVWGTTGSRR